MRPEDFSPGNSRARRRARSRSVLASMRPEDFSPGNQQRPIEVTINIHELQ